ncbi:MAG: asparaginase [Proteobacteria bacterium]|nr:asparaginase [Pseudomonadota bacterium]
MSEILVEVKRGSRTESVHRGSIVIVSIAGEVTHCMGNPEAEISMRSCAKPIQAIPVIESGAADHFAFSDRELALFCGSVSGQNFHVEAVRSVLKKIGLTEGALLCGVHLPSHRATAKDMQQRGIKPSTVHNNCAGKHAAMLALCVYHKWQTENYLPLEHPVQQLILSKLAAMAQIEKTRVHAAVDGCGVPVFFIPLRNLAFSYARFSQPFHKKELELSSSQMVIKRLMQAACEFPEMIAGDERICTDIMRTVGKSVFAKTGAEGGYALTLFDKGVGVAVKIEDGNPRAIGPVIIEVLNQLGILSPGQNEALKNYHHPIILNHRKEQVGELKPVFRL